MKEVKYKYYILRNVYCCTDWHDWKEYIEWIGKPEEKYEVNAGDFLKTVVYYLNHIDDFSKYDTSCDEVINTLKDSGTIMLEGEKAEDGTALETYSITYEKEKDTIDVHYNYNFCGYECVESYRLKKYDAEKVVYLPIEEFICFPKNAPGIQRCYNSYYRDYDEAIKAISHMNSNNTSEKSQPFMGSNGNLIIDEADKLDENEWYINNLKIASLTGYNPKEDSTWNPFINIQMENLKKEERWKE